MPVSSIDTSTNISIAAGATRNLTYNIDAPNNAEITKVAYRLWLGDVISGTNLSRADAVGDDDVDLGKVEVWLHSPEGDRATIFDIADTFGRQDDSVLGVDQDSDSSNDHDLYYDGSSAESTFSLAFDGQEADGTYRLEIRNRSDQSLTLNYFDLDITYDPAPDLTVSDIKVEGQMEVGETITIKADISNISSTDYTDGPSTFRVEYLANGNVIGSETIDFGFRAGLTLEYEEDFVVTSVGPIEIEVRIVGTSGEATTANNSRTEYFAQNHTQTKTLANSAEEVRLAGFLAHSAYGDVRLTETYNGSNSDNGLDDNYRGFLAQNGMTLMAASQLSGYFDGTTSLGATVGRFKSGGLYEGRSSGLTLDWEAQGLLVRETLSNGDTALVYAFRGTDEEDNSFLGGQAWTGNGLYDHYTAHRPPTDDRGDDRLCQ